MTFRARVRTGLGKYDDGWRVVVEWTDPDGKRERKVYDPPYATEAEAEAASIQVSRIVRESARATGIRVEDNR